MSDLKQLMEDSKGLPAAFRKTHPVGTVWRGAVTKVIVRTQRDDDGNLKAWDDGNPVQEVVIAIQTDQRDPERKNDDGIRGIYIKWWGEQKKAFREAMEEAGVDDVEIGGQFAAQFAGLGPQPRDPKLSPPKLMKFAYKPPTGLGGLLSGDDAATGNGAAGNGAQQVSAPPAATAPMEDPWGDVPATPPAQETWPAPAPAPAPVAPMPPPAAPVAATPTPAPTAAPTVAPAAPADPMALLATIKAFLSMGMTDAQIAGATGASEQAVAAVRALPA